MPARWNPSSKPPAPEKSEIARMGEFNHYVLRASYGHTDEFGTVLLDLSTIRSR